MCWLGPPLVHSHVVSSVRSAAVQASLIVAAFVAGPAWGIGVVLSALWANLYVDGDRDASTVEVLRQIAPDLWFFVLFALGVVLVSHLANSRAAQWVFAITSALIMVLVIFEWALLAIPVATGVVFIGSSARSRTWRRPAPDVVALVSGFCLILMFAVAEAHR